MCSVNHHNGIDQGGSGSLSLEIDYQSPVVVSESNPFTDLSGTTSPTSDGGSFLSHLSPQDLCNDCRCVVNIETISEIFNDSFLQAYAIKRGYSFTGDFLSTINKYKASFIEMVDFILTDLCSVTRPCGSFIFFSKDTEQIDQIEQTEQIEQVHKNVIDSTDKVRFSFSRSAYYLGLKCINVLQSDIIPMTIKSIFDSRVVGSGCERKMTYHEMEQLFLHFVASLEKLIIVKVMKYWHDFCNEKKVFLSLISDYSNSPGCVFCSSKVIPSGIHSPSSFTNKFGRCISFMAVAKIDEMISNFTGNLGSTLKKIVRSKCQCICNYSDRAYDDLKELREESRDKFKMLIEEEFSKKIIEEGISDKFGNFLKDIFIWNGNESIEKDRVLILENIIDCMRNISVDTFASSVSNIIGIFQGRLSLSKQRSLVGGRYLHTMEYRWGVKIHPEDGCRISYIRSKFSAKSKDVVRNKFCAMLKEGYKFLDGTVIDAVDWEIISKNLFPIAQDAIRHLVDEEYAELSKFLLELRVLDDAGLFDGSSAGTRKATSEEIDKILRFFSNSVYGKSRSLFRLVWRDLINGTKFNISKNLDSSGEFGYFKEISAVDTTSLPLVDSGNAKVPIPSVPSKITNTWGLNIHPDDDRLIFFIKRNILIKIKDNISRLFSSMLKRVTILPSGNFMFGSSWRLISGELFEMTKKSVEPIVEKQLVELDRILSEVRIVYVNEDDSSFCTKKVTDNEKKELMVRVEKLIDMGVKRCTRSSWLRVVDKSLTNTGYGYKEKYKDISGMGTEGKWGVKLRYSDNITILSSRRKFSSKIKDILYNIFDRMLKNKHEFSDGTFIGAFPWFRVSKKLFPIAKKEIEHILKEESKELEEIISKARVVVDSNSDREPTVEEKYVVLGNIMKLVHRALKKMFRMVWNDLITSTSSRSYDVSKIPQSSVEEVTAKEVKVKVGGKCDNLMSKLCYEDDLAISNIKRSLSAEARSCIINKFSEILKEKYEFVGGTTMDKLPWRVVSKKLLPIARKEVNLVLEKKLVKMSDILSGLHTDVSSPYSSGATRTMTRRLTSGERCTIMESIIKSVLESSSANLSRLWNGIAKSQSVGLADLKEMYKSNLDNIRLEFVGSLGLIVNEVVSDLGSTNSDVYNIAYERSHNFFKKGFFNKVESLLSYAQVVDTSGNDRFITCEERKCILREFMDIINSDRDCLIKKRTGKLKAVYVPTSVDSFSRLSVVGGRIKNDRSKRGVTTTLDLVACEHSYAKKAFHNNVI
ncbi:hypothetical protein [Candidatus Ichthyocystis hellenicum]|uniref:hypothetical protein n=1 Tax=Candidatus Ichthyocystis hellenicum TaxID=1561003 RepID=UPI000B809899|nr:hypothetical protein [Candidatus Ichthyocystis hellenicum]